MGWGWGMEGGVCICLTDGTGMTKDEGCTIPSNRASSDGDDHPYRLAPASRVDASKSCIGTKAWSVVTRNETAGHTRASLQIHTLPYLDYLPTYLPTYSNPTPDDPH
jgi:hypothetical protein